jgi:hypothetical protein
MNNAHRYLLMAYVCLASVTHAQVDISCRIKPVRAILYEPVIATVNIENMTGRPLVLSGPNANGRLRFDIEMTPGRTLPQTQFPLLEESVEIPVRESWSGSFILSDAYDMRQEGPYTVRARVDAAGEAFIAPRVFVDVVPGLEIMSLRSLAKAQGETLRLHRLMSVNRDRGEFLLLRIDDPEGGICYAVQSLGRIIRARPPRLEVDGDFNVHILHQTSPERFYHHVFSPNGRLISRRNYSGDGSAIGLEQTPEGRLIVTGGATSLTD